MDDARDRQAIMELKARYCRLLDTKDWDAWTQLFTEDLELDVSSQAGRPPLLGRDAALGFVIPFLGDAITVHHIHAPEITIDGDQAEAIWAMQDRVIGAGTDKALSFTGFGHYHERMVRQADGWKIASLKLTRLHVDLD